MPTPLPPFDLDLLRSFMAIADSGGFSRAAERIARTQSTISLQIKRLEAGLRRDNHDASCATIKVRIVVGRDSAGRSP